MECQQNYKKKRLYYKIFVFTYNWKKFYATENNRSKHKASGVVSPY